MLKYRYINSVYSTKVGTSKGTKVVKFGDTVEIGEKEREQFDKNSDFVLLSGDKAKLKKADIEEMINTMGWRPFQKFAKKKWGASDTSKKDLIAEILKKQGGN